MSLQQLDYSQYSVTDWPPLNPSLLGDARPTPPPFPLPLLPGRWRRWVEASAPVFGSADYLAHCLLGGVAGLAGAGIRIEVTAHWEEPLLLWQALVGGPSSGRTSAFRRVQGLLDELVPETIPGPVDEEEAGGSEAEILAPAVLVDSGLDRVSTTLRDSARGVMLWREDLGPWRGEAGRRSAWRAAWSAGPAVVDFRNHRCFAASVMGALSPDSLAAFTRGDGTSGGSLASRFLYAWPCMGASPSLADTDTDDAGLVALLRKIALVVGHREAPRVLPLDEAGKRRLEALMPEVQRLADESEGVAAEWIGRGVATIVRLAGLLSVMEWAETDLEYLPVGVRHIEAAHALWSGYYLPQALAVFDRAGARAGDQAARRVVRWLRRVRAPQISREEVRREALSQSVSADAAEEVLARLEAGGVLREVAVKEATRRGPRRRRWEVNPALAGNSANSASALAPESAFGAR